MASNSTAAQCAPIAGWDCVREIGRGAWTVVYQARPAQSERQGAADYALKVPLPELVRDQRAIAMLQREAFVAAQVAHSHLTVVLASQLDAPPRYLVLPYYAGSSLADVLARKERLSTPQALWTARQAAEALAALHAAGWLHRDVNPKNILLAPSGHATLIDLGLAERIGSASQRRRSELAGTPTHFAPELLSTAAPLNGAADVYSLGVVLYQLLVGTLPFTDDDPLQLVAAHLDTPPPAVRERLPHVSSRVARLVRRMLAKEPLRRPTSAELVPLLAELEIETFAERHAA